MQEVQDFTFENTTLTSSGCQWCFKIHGRGKPLSSASLYSTFARRLQQSFFQYISYHKHGEVCTWPKSHVTEPYFHFLSFLDFQRINLRTNSSRTPHELLNIENNCQTNAFFLFLSAENLKPDDDRSSRSSMAENASPSNPFV